MHHTRRGLLGAAAVLAATPAFGQMPAVERYPDPAVKVLDPSFNRYRLLLAAVERLGTGYRWSEGAAWFGDQRCLIWSDIPNNRQMRWIEDDGRVTVFRQPSGNSNGNTFDHQGRQLSCEHSGRRVVRYEHDGSVTVIADAFEGKRLNSPNDIACHPDGSYWFTDPPYGGQLYEGMPDIAGGPSNQEGRLNAKVGQPAGSGTLKRELSCNVYRVDPSGRIDMVISEEALGAIPNGITFAPDYKRVYIVNRGLVSVLDVVGPAQQVSKPRQFADFVVDGITCRTDGIRTDVFGNLWASSNAGAPVGYSGVTVWNPAGKLIGRIRLPETCANVAFGGPKRNRLFMAAGQSLYAVYTNSQGASPG